MENKLIPEEAKCRLLELKSTGCVSNRVEEALDVAIDAIEQLNTKMKLFDFMHKFIGCNSLVRLWRSCGSGANVELCKATMDWQLLLVKQLEDLPVVCVRDVLCIDDREAINIIVDTDYDSTYVQQWIDEAVDKHYKERQNCGEYASQV